MIAAVKAAGFRGSTTVAAGWASPTEDPYRLPRLEVLAGTARGAGCSPRSTESRDRPAPGSHYP